VYEKMISKIYNLDLNLTISFFVQKRMPENIFFDEPIRNFMIYIKHGAQSHKNSRIPEMSKNFQFFWNIGDYP
jgi:hypothetical protein